jgi:hypothetical protein
MELHDLSIYALAELLPLFIDSAFAILLNACMFQGLRLVLHWMAPVVLASSRS